MQKRRIASELAFRIVWNIVMSLGGEQN